MANTQNRGRANCPHKLTKTAEPWLGGGAASGGSELHARGTSAAVRSCHCVVSRGSRRAASGGRQGRRLLQLRVSTLGRLSEQCDITSANMRIRRKRHAPPSLRREARNQARPANARTADAALQHSILRTEASDQRMPVPERSP